MSLPRPPSADPLVALADQCVQCGLCLPACPTYRRERIEAESPRGRIALVRGWALDALEPTAAGDAHLDGCLACRSCEAVCPAGVDFGALLVEARRRQRARRGPSLRQRVAEALVRRPRLLRAALALYRRLFPLMPGAWRRLPRPPGMVSARRPALPAPPRPEAALFVGCIADSYEGPTRSALGRLLSACRVAVHLPDGQGCCGALHAHAGRTDVAASLASRNATAFDGHPRVLTLASGCHEAVAQACAPGQSVVDALDFLATQLDRLRFHPFAGRVALHLPCTQRNVVGSVPALRRLLAAVPDLDLVVIDAGYGCCGAAGTAMLTDPARAAGFRTPLLQQLDASGATLLLSANIGCRLHLQNGTAIPVRHPVDFLAAQLDESTH